MMFGVRLMTAAILSAGLAAVTPLPVAAQDDKTPCTTKSECDLRADLRDMRDRRAQWDANAKQQEDYLQQSRQLQAETRARNEGDKLTRLQEVMRRRRAAAAAAGN